MTHAAVLLCERLFVFSCVIIADVPALLNNVCSIDTLNSLLTLDGNISPGCIVHQEQQCGACNVYTMFE